MLGDFIGFCLHHGLGGLVLLLLAGGVTAIVLLALANAALWIAATFAQGFRRGFDRDSKDQDVG